jgi:hypothetical protein
MQALFRVSPSRGERVRREEEEVRGTAVATDRVTMADIAVLRLHRHQDLAAEAQNWKNGPFCRA